MAFQDDLGLARDDRQEPKGFVDDLNLSGEKSTDTAWERAKRVVSEDIPRLLTLRTPSGPPVAVTPPEESMLAGAEGAVPVAEPVSATPTPPPVASVPPTQPVEAAGPLSRARDAMFAPARELGSREEVLGIAPPARPPGIYAAHPETEGLTTSDIGKGVRQATVGFAAFPATVAEHLAEFALTHPFFSAYAESDPEAAKALKESVEGTMSGVTERVTQGTTPGSERVARTIGLPFEAAGLPAKGVRKLSEMAGADETTGQVIEDAALLATFAGIGVSPKVAKAVKDSTWYRKATIKERGLVVQTVEDLKRAGASEAELARKDPEYWKEAFKKRGGHVEDEIPAPPAPKPPKKKPAPPEAGTALDKIPIGTEIIFKDPTGNPASGVVTGRKVSPVTKEKQLVVDTGGKLPSGAPVTFNVSAFDDVRIKKEAVNAPKEGIQPEGRVGEHPGTGGIRTAAEAGGGDRTGQLPEAPAPVAEEGKEVAVVRAPPPKDLPGDLRAGDVKAEEVEIDEKDGKFYAYADGAEVAGPFESRQEAEHYKRNLDETDVVPIAKGKRPAKPAEDPIRKYASTAIGKDSRIDSISLVGSKVSGKGKDTDLLYEMKLDLPEDSVEAADAVTAAIEGESGIDLDTYDTHIKVGDRYFHVQEGAGREVIENTEYGKEQARKPKKILATKTPKAELRPEPHEVSEAPVSPPGDRWTGDRGAIPGEPSLFLDGDAKTAKAALVEVPNDKGEAVWEARIPGGRSLGKFTELADAAKAAEAHVDKPTERRAAPRPVQSGYPESEVPDLKTVESDIAAVSTSLARMREEYAKKKAKDPSSMDTLALADRGKAYRESLDKLQARKKELEKETPLDPTSMDVRLDRKKRDLAIKQSKAAGTVHLDQLSHDVESTRGKRIESIFDGSKGTVTSANSDGTMNIVWDDEASAKHNLGSLETDKIGNKEVQQWASHIGPSDKADFKVLKETRVVKKGVVEVPEASDTNEFFTKTPNRDAIVDEYYDRYPMAQKDEGHRRIVDEEVRHEIGRRGPGNLSGKEFSEEQSFSAIYERVNARVNDAAKKPRSSNLELTIAQGFNVGDTVYFRTGFNKEPQKITHIDSEGNIRVEGSKATRSPTEFTKRLFKGLPVDKPGKDLTDADMDILTAPEGRAMSERNRDLGKHESDPRFLVYLKPGEIGYQPNLSPHLQPVHTDYRLVRDFLKDGTLPERGKELQKIADRYRAIDDKISEVAAIKSAAMVRTAIERGAYNTMLHPSNKISRNIFYEITGQKLPAGVGATQKFFTGKPFEKKAAWLKEKETAAEVEGAPLAETEKIADAFMEAKDTINGEDFQVTHIFDPPKKDEVVRLQDKVKTYVAGKGWMSLGEAKVELEKWKANAAKQGKAKVNSGKIVLSLFDLTGEWAKPWAEAGYDVFTFDIQNDPEMEDINKFSAQFLNEDWGAFGGDIYAIISANPCTDFAVSGARHFAVKDANGKTVESVELVHQTLRTIEYLKPQVWAIENPVGRIEKLTGLPPWRLSFDPNHFGDPYTKKTLLWGRFNADLPIAPVEPTEGSKMWSQYGGKSQATKNARAQTPEGFAYAFFQANNYHDNKVMGIANKYDRLNPEIIKKALDSGMTEQDIGAVVDDHFYMDLNDKAAEKALLDAIGERGDKEEKSASDPPATLPSGSQRFQWMRNKEAGQKFGNKEVVAPLTRELYEKYVTKLSKKPLSWEEYNGEHPDTWISLYQRYDMNEWKPSSVSSKEEVIGDKLTDTTGWVIKVDSFSDPKAIEHGKTADSEVAKPEAPVLETEKEPTAKEVSAAAKVAGRVSEYLKKKKVLSAHDLFKWADEAYGGTQAQGKYTVKDAYDAMELGVNKAISQSMVTDPTIGEKAAKDQVAALKKMIQNLPTQSKRTSEMDAFQQFSTPPPLAFAANWVANLRKDDVFLEPSAGIGGIAIFAKNAKVKEVVVNELSPRRAEILKEFGFDRVFQENAEQLNNILPKDVVPSVVVMNPPFSATAGRMGDKKEIQTGAVHIEQALKRLAEDGRLVAIVGRGMAPDRPAFRNWWNNIKKTYTVKANVGVSGKEYTKYGTAFDNRILVIDKTGPTPNMAPVTGDVEKIEELIDLLKGVRDGRPEVSRGAVAGEQKPPEPAVEKRPEAAESPAGSVLPVQPAVGGRGDREGVVPAEGARPAGEHPSDVRVEAGGRAAVPRAERPGRPDRTVPAVEGEGARPGEVGNGDLAGDRGQVERPIGIGVPGVGTGLPVEGVEVQTRKAEKSTEKEFSESIYEQYRPQKVSVANSKPHPGKLVESAAMSIVQPPDPTYKPHIPKEIISSGKLSEAQLESIIYAGQAHSEKLPEGVWYDAAGKPIDSKLSEDSVFRQYRKGYFIGDGTGVGKGREISGILLDNWNQGRKKAVWISQNSPLIDDAKRDVKGIGWDPNLIFNFGKSKLGAPIQAKEGIAFLGYGLLKSKKPVKSENKILPGEEGLVTEKKVFKSRLDQLTEWLGPDFDGVVIFDEAHNLGNAIAVRGHMGMSKPSETALAGVELQRRLPDARVLYVSATGATEVKNLSFADRLGLWGEGTPFPNKRDFIDQIDAGGMAAMEIVARDMKSMGNYLARSLSYDDVIYDRLEHILTPEQRTNYDELAKAWQVVLHNINSALEAISPSTRNGRPMVNGRAKSNAMSAFWGAHQRFFNQIITSMQTPTVITAIEKDLQEGRAVVIQLVNTNEAAQGRALSRLEEDQELEDLDMTPRDQLMELVRNSFPVQQYESYLDDSGNESTRPVVDSKGKPVENADAVAMREALLDTVGSIRVPSGPLEMLFDHFGTEKVAEVTGRTQRVVKHRDEKGERKIVERRSQAKTMADADAFANDKKQVLVFSNAGGTGRSYHADLGIKNQRLRRHYVLQAGWQANRVIQGLGRSHRTNQKQAPQFILVTTDLKGQKRFTSSIARRLDQLGALTRGQRETGSQGFFGARDNLESVYAQRALNRLIEDISRRQVPEMDIQDFQNETGIRVTNENGNLDVSRMPPITQFLNRILSMTIDKQNQFFDLFSDRMDAQIRAAVEDGTLDQGLETLRAKKIEKIQEQIVYTDKTGAETKYVELEVTNPAHLLKFGDLGRYSKGGYVQNVKSGRVWSRSESMNRTDRYGDIETGFNLTGVDGTRHPVTKENVEDPKKFKVLTKDEARALWDREYDAAPKERKHREHMITGTLLPIWDRLQGHPRIMRAQTAEGERVLGRIINPSDVATTLKNLGASKSAVKMTGKEIHDSILKQNYTVELANGWSLVRRRVSDEQRIEIVGPDYNVIPELKRNGAFTERIGYQTRVFVPTGEEGAAVIEKITENRPVTSAEPPALAKAGILGSEEGFLDVSLLLPGIEAGKDVRAGITSLLLPTAKSAEHLQAAEVLGAKLGSSHRDAEIAAQSLDKDSRVFDKMGVHDPSVPPAKNIGIKFMSDMSQGRQMAPDLQRVADKVKNLFDDRLRKLEAAGAGLRTVRENYFPGMWTNKTTATAFLSKRPFKGKESFRKQKVFDDIMEGIEAGLVPISNNPIDLVKLKLAEMDRSIMANRALREWEKKGDVAEIPYNKPVPDGWAKINDKYGTVWGPPSVPVWRILREMAKGSKKDLYLAEFGKEVFPSGLEVAMGADDTMKREANGLEWAGKGGKSINIHAMHRGTGRSYSQLIIEKLLEDHDAFEEQAPTIYAKLQEIADTSERIRDILAMPTFQEGLKLPVGGWVNRGSRIAKKPVAEILNNFLSSSIYNSPYFGTAFKAYMGTANALNQTQLGVGSAFHAGFTSADVQISHNAEVIKDIYGVVRGNRTLGDLGRTIKKVPAAIITNPRRGSKVVAEWRTPTLEVPVNVPVGQLPQGNEARVAMIAKAMELAGGASRIERGLKTEWTEKQIREWYGNQKVKAAARTPIVLVELMAKPIMEWLVPRQKAGVFGELAGRIIEQNPGKTMEQLIPQFRQAWNRVDARLGQVVYDRLFINNMAKNVIQGAIRAPGWTGGTIGEIGGAPKDLINFFAEWKRTGKAPENIPDRVAYVLALLATVTAANGLLTYAFTGEDPDGMDWWAFRTSGYDEQGKAERFILPTYAKDMFAWYQDWGHTLLAKTHPLLGMMGDIWRNRDYYGVKVRNEDDPWIKQLLDVSVYGFKQFEPFWIRGAKKETQRGGGFVKTITEEPQKILAPQLGIMPATSAYTKTPFEKFAGKVLEERRPKGTRTKEEAEHGDMKRELEQKLRRGDPGAEDELRAAMTSGDITRVEAQNIRRRSKEDHTTKTAKSMTLEDLAAGIPLASAREKALIKPIFEKKIRNKTGEIDGKIRDKYIDILRAM